MPRRRSTPRASVRRRGGTPRGRGSAGLILFLAGVLVGGLAFYIACREPADERGDLAAPATEAGERQEEPAPAPRPAAPAAVPAAKSAQEGEPAAPDGGARIALVIDDLGRSLEEIDALAKLGVPLTYAVLPFEEKTPEVVAELRRRGAEILCHLPMEPANGADPGPGALRSGMSGEELRAAALAALDAVPGAAGVNNHMGSELSTDEDAMGAVLALLPGRKLFFLDSRTSPRSVGYRVATALGIPAAERQVFLDDDLRPEAVRAQFARLLEVARQRGSAIAIGHPHPATLAVLAEEVPRAKAGGFEMVPVSFLLDRPGELPE